MGNYFDCAKTAFNLAVCTLAAGCAVTPGQVNNQAEAIEKSISVAAKTANGKFTQEPAFVRIKGNYLGNGFIPLNAGNALPAKFNKFVLNFGRTEGSFVEAAKNIRDATGLPIRLNPDIYVSTAIVTNSVPTQTNAVVAPPVAQPGGGPLPANLPAMRTGSGVPIGFAAQASATQIPAYMSVSLNFSGELGDYLTAICSTAGLSWEFDAGEIHFYRLTTRTFSVDQAQQTLDVTDVTNSGGQTSTSAAGGTGSGSGSGTSTAVLSSKFDLWMEFVESVKGMLSPAGKVVANRATGTFVVTDTKPTVERIAAVIAAENAKLRTRVDIEIRTITFELNEGTNIGADFSIIYKALQGNYSLQGTAPQAIGTNVAPSNITYTNIGSDRLKGSSISLSGLDQYGKVIGDKTDTVRARNRVPAMVQGVRDEFYLASTTPATGGGTSGGTGVPGLTPGLVTYGTFFTLTPNVTDNGTVIINFSTTESRRVSMEKVSTGKDATFQQITTPVLARGKNVTDLVIPKGGTEISVSSASESWSSQSNLGVTGASALRTRSRVLTITLVTPHVLPGV